MTLVTLHEAKQANLHKNITLKPKRKICINNCT